MKERLRNDIGVESFLRETERIKKRMRSVQCAGRVFKREEDSKGHRRNHTDEGSPGIYPTATGKPTKEEKK